jgi:hypothetical protein
MTEPSQNQTQRLNYLEFRVLFTGQIGRADLMNRFGISEAAATRDLCRYRELAPANLKFDKSQKIYRIGDGFGRYLLKDVESRQLLRALIQGVGDDFGINAGSMISCELPAQMQVLEAETLAAVSRAIYQKCVLQIEYFSMTGNHGLREIVPFSIASTGLKWMVRAYCRRKNIFCDFVLNRIKRATVLSQSFPKEFETKEYDDEWNRFLRLELVPHPSATVENQAKTEQEFQMEEGVYYLRVRAALAGFVLRLWSVDCSENHRLTMMPLSLRNRLVLHDVDSAKLAPGYRNLDQSVEV